MSHTEPPNNGLSGSHTGSQKKGQNPEYIAFTDKSIKHLKSTSKRRVVWAKGLPGLGIRISPKGTKSFVFKYDHEGQDRWITFGQYPKMKLHEALEKYADAIAKAEAGEDPAAKSVQKNKVARKAPTVRELAEEYIERHAKPNKRSWSEDQRLLDYNVLGKWGARKAHTITRRDVIALLDDIVARGAPIQANRTLAVIRKMFNFAVDRDVLEYSPCFRVKPPAKERVRDRYLTLDEIKTFWNKVETAPLQDKTKLALKLLLATLQRVNEVLGIHISELDLQNKIWVIPKERSKNKRAQLVPLSPLAIEIIEELMEELSEDGLLFSSTQREGYYDRSVLSHAITRNREHFGLKRFTPHDLRRTGSTQLAAFKVPRFDRERVLNHTDRTIAAVYDLHEYEDEKRAALDLWSDIIQACADSAGKVNIDALKARFKYQDYFAG